MLSGCAHAKVMLWCVLTSLLLQRENLENELVGCVGEHGADVVLSLLTWNPEERLSAADALQLPFFNADTLQPCEAGAELSGQNAAHAAALGTSSASLLGALRKEQPGVKSGSVAAGEGHVNLVATALMDSSLQSNHAGGTDNQLAKLLEPDQQPRSVSAKSPVIPHQPCDVSDSRTSSADDANAAEVSVGHGNLSNFDSTFTHINCYSITNTRCFASNSFS